VRDISPNLMVRDYMWRKLCFKNSHLFSLFMPILNQRISVCIFKKDKGKLLVAIGMKNTLVIRAI
jgi:hypothetical protein